MTNSLRQVIAYIDGFNLYHAIAELNAPELKWVNLWQLCESLLREGETLAEVNYFSAFYTKNPPGYARHRQYVAGLKDQGVRCHMAKFKAKNCRCKLCRRIYTAQEEKETDVHIAVKMVEDAFLGRFDRAIVVSADTDLLPPIASVRRHFPGKEVFVVAPPGRMGRARALSPRLEITKGRIRKALLPVEGRDRSGKLLYQRPPGWS